MPLTTRRVSNMTHASMICSHIPVEPVCKMAVLVEVLVHSTAVFAAYS
jgi:hypothetical protein